MADTNDRDDTRPPFDSPEDRHRTVADPDAGMKTLPQPLARLEAIGVDTTAAYDRVTELLAHVYDPAPLSARSPRVREVALAEFRPYAGVVIERWLPLAAEAVYARGFDDGRGVATVADGPVAPYPTSYGATHEDGGFDEDTASVRGPGWGTRSCTGCDFVTFGGTEVVTEEQMHEHIEDPGAWDTLPRRSDVPAGWQVRTDRDRDRVSAGPTNRPAVPTTAITTGRAFPVVLELPGESDVPAADTYVQCFAGDVCARLSDHPDQWPLASWVRAFTDAWAVAVRKPGELHPRRWWLAFIVALGGLAKCPQLDTDTRLATAATIADVTDRAGLVLA